MEKLFSVTKDLGLCKYFIECPDVRMQLRDLFDHTHQVIQREKEISLEVVLLIGALELKNPAVNLSLWGGRRELAEKLGLTFDQYLKRAQAGRVLWRHRSFRRWRICLRREIPSARRSGQRSAWKRRRPVRQSMDLQKI